ncbi:MAG: AbrB/MazE/SpoVT family DNA-binding domain-containing protein [Dehalococcoidia bacterium]|nr:AbrB/MazE/SpoVT family DNA-binding domain-containing protein [Dehalococcoidia bacterium]
MEDHEYYSSVSPKGQITLPAVIRHELGIKPRDQVVIDVKNGEVRIRPVQSKLLTHFGKAGRLTKPMKWADVTRVAADEHALMVSQEGEEE